MYTLHCLTHNFPGYRKTNTDMSKLLNLGHTHKSGEFNIIAQDEEVMPGKNNLGHVSKLHHSSAAKSCCFYDQGITSQFLFLCLGEGIPARLKLLKSQIQFETTLCLILSLSFCVGQSLIVLNYLVLRCSFIDLFGHEVDRLLNKIYGTVCQAAICSEYILCIQSIEAFPEKNHFGQKKTSCYFES